MINENSLSEMHLPGVNENENLETISENQFRLLFEPSKFELCSRDIRDKGIDLTYSIKKNEKQTGFRFIVQLKATDSVVPNKDGSFSYTIQTSNINYLLNNSSPAFYVLYDLRGKVFFCIGMHELLIILSEKENWQQQSTHTIRFSKILTSVGVEEMFKTALEFGLAQRNIKERNAAISTSLSPTDKIIIDQNMQVIDDASIREMIEGIGFDLINQGSWNEVISIHKKASGSIATTALYNLILGVANYHTGNKLDAILFLKTASLNKNQLNDNLNAVLQHFITTSKFSIGMISKDEYEHKMKQLENNEAVGLYVKLEHAKYAFIKSMSSNFERSYGEYINTVNNIIKDTKSNENIVLMAQCELILVEGHRKNMDYVQSICQLNAIDEEFGPNAELRASYAIQFIEANKIWYNNLELLQKHAIGINNYFAYFVSTINEVKIIYEFTVYSDLVSVNMKIPGSNPPDKPETTPLFNALISKVENAITYFKTIGHTENLIVSKSIKYEILHYTNNHQEANKLIDDMESLIDLYDLTEHKQKLDYLKNAGTIHEKFSALIHNSSVEAVQIRKEWEEKLAELKHLDKIESETIDKKIENPLTIHLFPMGYFQFPTNMKERAYEILNITDQKTRSNFDLMFEKVIPVANVYCNPITSEGYGDGDYEFRSFENFKNMYRVRKAFYANKFYRMNKEPGM